jgi:hypothetical protein
MERLQVDDTKALVSTITLLCLAILDHPACVGTSAHFSTVPEFTMSFLRALPSFDLSVPANAERLHRIQQHLGRVLRHLDDHHAVAPGPEPRFRIALD